MRNSQLVSPIVVFILIIITLLIIYYRGTIGVRVIQDSMEYSSIYSDLIALQDMDMNYRLNLSNILIYYLSTINSSGTIEQIMEQYNVTDMVFDYPVRLNYVKEQCMSNDKCVLFNSSLAVPYPYSELNGLEESLDIKGLSSCIQNNCLKAEQCVDNFDTEEYNYTLIFCLIYPTRIKLSVSKNGDPISTANPYYMFNNSAIVLS